MAIHPTDSLPVKASRFDVVPHFRVGRTLHVWKEIEELKRGRSVRYLPAGKLTHNREVREDRPFAQYFG